MAYELTQKNKDDLRKVLVTIFDEPSEYKKIEEKVTINNFDFRIQKTYTGRCQISIKLFRMYWSTFVKLKDGLLLVDVQSKFEQWIIDCVRLAIDVKKGYGLEHEGESK